MSLYNAYKDYYSSLVEPEKYTSSTGFVSSEFIDSLIDEIQKNDVFLDASYIKLRSQYVKFHPPNVPKHSRSLMVTSGTSKSIRRSYHFGPHFDYIKRSFWALRMFPTGPSEIIPFITRFKENFKPKLIKSISSLYSKSILCGRICDESVQPLIEILGQFEKVTLVADPDVFLFLNKNNTFVDYCISNSHRINLISQQWESFYKKSHLLNAKVHMMDVMMDWSTGLNFHMCSANQYHVLPISVGQQNLLNLVPFDLDWVPNADLFEQFGTVQCECGKNRMNFLYHPHSMMNVGLSYGYDLSIAENLETNFQSIQFHQNDTTLTIFYEAETDVTSKDKEYLTEYWKNFGYNVFWDEHNHYQTPGYKRPTFFRWLPK